jgi:type IV secretion system protein VirD4
LTPLAKGHWPARLNSAHGSVLRTTALVLVGAGAALTLVLYLAGYLFLWVSHGNPISATPRTLAQYYRAYGENVGLVHRMAYCLSAACVLTAAPAVIVLLLKRTRSLHGDARFAHRAEIANAGLLGSEGIILGRLGRRYLMLAGQQSVLLAAPPRSGKDVGVVVPNGLHWPGSLMQVDIKRESWMLTAGFRAAHGQACYRFEPLEPQGHTAHWNPLSYVSPDADRRIDDIQRIADILYAENPGSDPFWVASARNLFLGICLYLFETPSLPKTLGEVRRQGMATDNEGFGAHWHRIVQGRQSGDHRLSDECVRALFDVIDLAPVTASSVRKTFTSRLELWANPMLDAATGSDDFDLRELRKKPTSIYVCVDPDDLHRMRPVLSLLFQQAIGLQTKELPEHNRELKHAVLFLLNEFTALGRINVIAESMAYMPGYNLRVLMVIQAPSQLREVYGPYAAETMMKSVAARILFAPKDYPDAKEISEELGFTTVRVRSDSEPHPLALGRHRSHHRSRSYSQQARALLLPQEVKELGTEQALILYEGLRPIRCHKIRYYRDPCFTARLYPPPESAVPGGPKRGRPTASTEAPPPVAQPPLRVIGELAHPSASDLEADVQLFLDALTNEA